MSDYRNPNPSDPGHQHSSQTQKSAKSDWEKLVKASDLQCEFQLAFKSWITDKSKSQDVITIGKQLMQLQNETGKSGGRLSQMQVYHRVLEAEDCIAKGLDKPVAKQEPTTGKLIRKTADGGTEWVLKL